MRTPFGDTAGFDIRTGTLQGDVLAPFLFIMVLDRVLAETYDGQGGGVEVLKGSRTRSRVSLQK